ncbi:hypothetical protein [Brucella pituitosa]|uniref:hypothetical protein n=1 Tax=Brucella pituitosa TaxID=571256 RepID=UPI0009A20677|nr:hypothetical protein [Brucella pituitosa]
MASLIYFNLFFGYKTVGYKLSILNELGLFDPIPYRHGLAMTGNSSRFDISPSARARESDPGQHPTRPIFGHIKAK